MKIKMHWFFLLFALISLGFGSCTKSIETSTEINESESSPAVGFATYTIQQGSHNSDQVILRPVETAEMKFAVLFDNSAIYTSIVPNNQYDINKLYGFSEGVDNQYNSARIGWNWYDNALHLYAYVYNKGVRLYSEIKAVAIGEEIPCSIKVAGNNYIFRVDNEQVKLSRGLNTPIANGYQQYPYFGGDEVAPHTITIKIKNL